MNQPDSRHNPPANPPQASDSCLLSEQDGKVLRLTLNRPLQFNALSIGMMNSLSDALKAAASDDSVRIVVIAAAGKAFCAGHDLKELMALPDTDAQRALFEQCARLMMQIQALPQPVIAQVQGLATAAGCQLVAVCDLAVAAESARFAVSGVNLGLFCSTPAVPLSRNLLRKHAMEMLLTGDFISAQDALAKGLVNRVVPADQLSAAVGDLASHIARKPPEVIALGKRLFYEQLETGVQSAYQLAAHTMACNLTEQATEEGIRAFMEKRKPSW
jgi:enoyl-CoA hydratase/carnithine racemase